MSRETHTSEEMECIGILYDKAGSAENVHITVPLNNDIGKLCTRDMLKSLPILQQRINDILTAKIGDKCDAKPTEERKEDRE
ncbi:hypothetical protein TcWFU_006094 [Taenia crassiceps]|uniref:Uncharacterized protein n=1 Tax=Taenia crassiceps TaxID=6207 RepID=A0ABR4QB91_9CEST